jgi:hypothetical protein
MSGKGTEPTRARARLRFADLMDPSDYITALYNPTQLDQKIQARTGSPKPIGGAAVPQYEGTDGFETFSIVLQHSERRMLDKMRHGGKKSKDRWTDRDEAELPMAERWLISKLHPRGYGLAPSRLMLLWPNTCTMLISVDAVQRSIVRWDEDLVPRQGTLIVTVTEHVEGLRTAGYVMAQGMSGIGLGGIYNALNSLGVDGGVGAVGLGIGSGGQGGTSGQ